MADPRISNMRPADLAIIQSAKADAAKASLRREVAETKFASWAEQGFAVLDNRRVLLGSL